MGVLDGKVAVVTGAAGGLGDVTARRIAGEGAAVVATDLDETGAAAVTADIEADGGRALAVRCDLTDEADIARLAQRVLHEVGGVDLLVNNAAAILPGDVDAGEIESDVFDTVLSVNLRAPLLLSRALIPSMVGRGGGAIVNVSSGAGLVGEPTRVAYGASKAALNSLTRHLAARYGREGIRANSIAPGLILTPQVESGLPDDFKERLRRRNPTGRLGLPDDVANVVLFLLSDAAAYVNGQTICVDGGQLVVG